MLTGTFYTCEMAAMFSFPENNKRASIWSQSNGKCYVIIFGIENRDRSYFTRNRVPYLGYPVFLPEANIP